MTSAAVVLESAGFDGKRKSVTKRLEVWLIGGFCFLCPLTNVRAGEIQPIEIFGLACLIVAYGFLALSNWRFQAPPQLARLIRLQAALLFIVTLLAITALRLETFPPFALPLLKTSPLLSLSRIVQLAICIGGFLLMVLVLVRRPALILMAAQLYVWSGLLSAAYALTSFAAWHFGLEFQGAYNVSFIRARGFFVEGGPFGVYLVSVITAACFRTSQLGQPRVNCVLQLCVLVAALMTTQSKAALLLGVFMLIVWQIADRRYSRLALGAILIAPIFVFFAAQGGIGNYVRIVLNFEDEIQTHSDDTSFAMGRIMATVLAPRMIFANPILGVGIGNYSLQRNNPQLLDGLPTTNGWDLPGLSYIGYAAELGIPCTLFLIWLIWLPVRIANKRLVMPACIALIAYQFLAHLFGAQITFSYPWVTTAIGLAYSLTQRRGRRISDGQTFHFVWRRPTKFHRPESIGIHHV